MPALFTEEDLKNRILLPYLDALGIGPERLQFERTFHIRLGRSEITRHAKETQNEAGGRLDCLVENQSGEPLFVVEAKGPRSSLTLDDRDQGISYARLLHPIAPFVLLTNGDDSRIYDTITKTELNQADFPEESEFYRTGRSLSTPEELKRRQEALENFVGYSDENVQAFSAAQKRARMAQLRSETAQNGSKYVPSLYTSRKEVRIAVESFLDSDEVLFALGGIAGVGKTNEACALADWLGESEIVLFFNGSELYGSLKRTLSDEFNWEFSQQLELPQVISRLAGLGRASDRRAVIVIDAIDEAPIDQFPQELSDLVTQLESFGNRVKLLVTSKWLAWQDFAHLRGNPAPTQRLMYETETSDGIPRKYRERCANEPAFRCARMSFVIEQFSADERCQAFQNYEDEFLLPEAIPDELESELADPFLLRTYAEAFQDADELPRSIETASLLRSYLRAKLERTENPNRSERELHAVAKALVAEGDEHASGELSSAERSSGGEVLVVPEARARKVAGIGVSENFADELVRFGLLSRTRGLEQSRLLAFTYERVRDYVTATRVLGLIPQSPSTPDSSQLSRCLNNPVAEKALRWYIGEAPDSHLDAYHEFVRERMGRFVATYVDARALLSPSIWRHLEPETEGPVGLVFDYNPPGDRTGDSVALAFYPRSTDQPQLRYREGFFAEVMRAYDVHEVPFAPIEEIRTRSLFELLRDPAKKGVSRFLEEIREAVNEGGLDDSSSEPLTHEKIVSIVHNNRDALDFPRVRDPDSWADRLLATDLYPLDLEVLWQKTQILYATEYFRLQWINQQRQLQHEARGGQRSLTIGPDQRQQFENEAHQAVLDEGREFEPPRHFVGGRETNVLGDLLKSVLPDTRTIEKPLHPAPDIPGAQARRSFTESFSDDQLCRYLESLFSEALNAYERLVPDNFGKLASEFGLYNSLPVMAVVYCNPDPRQSVGDQQIPGGITYGFIRLDDNTPNSAEATVAPSESPFDIRSQPWCRTAETSIGTRQLIKGPTITRLSSIVRPAIRFPIGWQVSQGAGAYARVRTLTYRWIREALRNMNSGTALNRLKKDSGST